MRAFLAQLGDEAAGSFGEAVTEFFELLVGKLEIPAGFNGAPALLKLASVSLGEMSFGIALHVHRTKLDIAAGEQALGDGQKTGEIIVHDDEHPPEAPFQQTAEHGFPVLEIFAAEPWQAAEDLLAAIAAQTNDEVDAGRA